MPPFVPTVTTGGRGALTEQQAWLNEKFRQWVASQGPGVWLEWTLTGRRPDRNQSVYNEFMEKFGYQLGEEWKLLAKEKSNERRADETRETLSNLTSRLGGDITQDEAYKQIMGDVQSRVGTDLGRRGIRGGLANAQMADVGMRAGLAMQQQRDQHLLSAINSGLQDSNALENMAFQRLQYDDHMRQLAHRARQENDPLRVILGLAGAGVGTYLGAKTSPEMALAGAQSGFQIGGGLSQIGGPSMFAPPSRPGRGGYS